MIALYSDQVYFIQCKSCNKGEEIFHKSDADSELLFSLLKLLLFFSSSKSWQLVALPPKTILNMRQFLEKPWTVHFYGKRATKTMSAGTVPIERLCFYLINMSSDDPKASLVSKP